MALSISKQQYQSLEELFAQVYNQASEAQNAVRLLGASWDGAVVVSNIHLTQTQLDARELSLKQDWADAKTDLIALIDAILGV